MQDEISPGFSGPFISLLLQAKMPDYAAALKKKPIVIQLAVFSVMIYRLY